jgi:hypothetical protein
MKGVGRHYLSIVQDSIVFTRKIWLLKITRKNQSAYIQLKTGMSYLKTYFYRLSLDLYCTEYNGRLKQSPAHLILHCKAYATERLALQKKIRNLSLTLSILFTTGTGRQALAIYLVDTGICTA